MSTITWKNVVTGRQRIEAGTPRGLYGPASRTPAGVSRSQRGARMIKSAPNFVTPSLSWLRST
jgi:hypothetical protein